MGFKFSKFILYSVSATTLFVLYILTVEIARIYFPPLKGIRKARFLAIAKCSSPIVSEVPESRVHNIADGNNFHSFARSVLYKLCRVDE